MVQEGLIGIKFKVPEGHAGSMVTGCNGRKNSDITFGEYGGRIFLLYFFPARKTIKKLVPFIVIRWM